MPDPIKTEHSKPGSKNNESEKNNSFIYNQTHMDKKNALPIIGSDHILRPANSFTCNGYSPQKTDSCYYY